jgi:hypothetical protein
VLAHILEDAERHNLLFSEATLAISSATPLFTVVIPCYRAATTIATAISSVIAQNETDFELIVVDDGSPDDSISVAISTFGDDPRCRILPKANGGPSLARNIGVGAGRGRLVAFLDADDRWDPGLLAAHRDHFAACPSLGVSFARTRFYDPDMASPGRISAHHASLGLGQMLAENPLCSTSNLVVRRDVFTAAGGFDVGLTHAEDQEFVARILATTSFEVAGIDAELVHYRNSLAGLSADLDRMAQGWDRMMQRVRSYAEPTAFDAVERPAAALHARYLARRALRTGQPALLALDHLRTAFRTAPRALLGPEFRRTLLTAAGVVAALALPRCLVAPLLTR